MDIKLVVFDVAATTVMSNNQVEKALNNAFINAGYTVSDSQISKAMGRPKSDAIKMILSDFLLPSEIDKLLIDSIYDDFTHQVMQLYCDENDMQPLSFGSCRKIIKIVEE